MSQQEKMKNDFLKEVEGYILQLLYTKDLISVLKDIEDLDYKLATAPNFTLITECALSDSYMLVLMRLYDKSKESKNIYSLIEKCKKNSFLFKNEKEVLSKIAEFQDELEEDEYICHTINVLRERRDTIYAHNDSKYFGDKIEKDKTYLKTYHILILVDFTERLLTYIFSLLSSEEMNKVKYDNDLKKLFEKQSLSINDKA